MKPVQPPIVATWLLNHFVGLSKDSLTGDLIEEMRQGRSRLWYWRQVVSAIVSGFYRESVDHPIFILSGIAMRWAMWFAYTQFMHRLFVPALRHRIAFFVLGFPNSPFMWLILTMDSLAMFVTGWAVVRLHRSHQITVLLGVSLFTFLSDLWLLPQIWFHATHSLTNIRFLPYLAVDLAYLILPTLTILLGGLWAIARQRSIAAEHTHISI